MRQKLSYLRQIAISGVRQDFSDHHFRIYQYLYTYLQLGGVNLRMQRKHHRFTAQKNPNFALNNRRLRH